MTAMKAQVLEKDGKKEFVVLSWEDFEQIKETLEDYDDLRELRKAKALSKGTKPIPFAKALKAIQK
jgi:PHD/YefM family antitoxin component YafN of YafNO toxin-antitoxin module